MKKALVIVSLLLLTGWAIGAFLLHAPATVHSLLLLSLIIYIRSLLWIAADTAPEEPQRMIS